MFIHSAGSVAFPLTQRMIACDKLIDVDSNAPIYGSFLISILPVHRAAGGNQMLGKRGSAGARRYRPRVLYGVAATFGLSQSHGDGIGVEEPNTPAVPAAIPSFHRPAVSRRVFDDFMQINIVDELAAVGRLEATSP